jgi:hypothetical protein
MDALSVMGVYTLDHLGLLTYGTTSTLGCHFRFLIVSMVLQTILIKNCSTFRLLYKSLQLIHVDIYLQYYVENVAFMLIQ